MTIFLFADYDDGLRGAEAVASYKGVGISGHDDSNPQRWNTGDYEEDQQLAHEEALRLGATQVACLSSIDHYYMDRSECDPGEQDPDTEFF